MVIVPDASIKGRDKYTCPQSVLHKSVKCVLFILDGSLSGQTVLCRTADGSFSRCLIIVSETVSASRSERWRPHSESHKAHNPGTLRIQHIYWVRVFRTYPRTKPNQTHSKQKTKHISANKLTNKQTNKQKRLFKGANLIGCGGGEGNTCGG